jgi:hypothetical protein
VPPHTATCPVAPDLAFLSRRAPVLSCVLCLRTSPSYQGELQRCHMSCGSTPRLPTEENPAWCCHVTCGFGPRLPIKESSDVVTCPVAPDLASLPKRAPALPHVPQVCTRPPPLDRVLALQHVPWLLVSHGPQARRESSLAQPSI